MNNPIFVNKLQFFPEFVVSGLLVSNGSITRCDYLLFIEELKKDYKIIWMIFLVEVKLKRKRNMSFSI